MWYGIGAYVKKFPQVRYLFGPVSISNSYPNKAKDLLVNFYRHYFPAPTAWASARLPYQSLQADGAARWLRVDYSEGFTQLKGELTAMELSVPTLYKQYTELCEDGGVQFVDFNIDPDFSDCVDGLVLVDLHKLKETKRKRYLS